MKSPLISVITPAYNAEKYISETIESILQQSFKDFEFIIIDDKSTDQTRKIIEEYSKKDARIKLFSNSSNLGIAGNRNKGVKLATGKYIAWQDADDISLPTRLEKQSKYLERNPDVAICGSYLKFFDATGVLSVRKYASTDKELRKNIFRFSPVAQPSAMIRRKCLTEVGEYDLRWPPAEDLDMSFRLGAKYKFANIPEILVLYREHPSSATFSKLKVMELNTIAIRKKYSSGFGYSMTLFDKLYNSLQYLSIFIVPPKMKIWLFNKLRNNIDKEN